MSNNWNLIKKSFVGGLCFIIILLLIGMNSSNANISFADGIDDTCGTCHADAGGVTTITMTNWPSNYSLDTQYNVTVSVTDSVLSTGMAGVWISTDGAGTLGIGNDPHLKVKETDLIHSDAGATSWNFTWDSPVINLGTVTLTVYAMVINNAGDFSGDSWATVTNNSLSPISSPNVPQSLIATPGDSQVSLSWGLPIYDGGSTITHYRIYRSTTSGDSYTNIANTTELSYSDTTVLTGIPYYYVISAVNDEGESGYSIEASVTLQTTTTTQSSSIESTTSTSLPSTSTTITTSSTPIGLIGFLVGIAVLYSIRWLKKYERR